MFMKKMLFRGPAAAGLLVFTSMLLTAPAFAQADDIAALKAQGKALVDSQKFTEALPVYDKLSKLAPKDPELFRKLVFSLLGQSLNTADADERRQLRIRARDSFVLARDLGDDSLLIKGLLDGLPANGADPAGYSDNA